MATATRVEFEYVQEVNPNLICCICYTPFVDPVCGPCSHTFCKDCISQYLSSYGPTSSNTRCPIDRVPLAWSEIQPAVSIVRNLVDELVIYCPRRAQGCEWTGQRVSLSSHECEWDIVPCRNVGCGVELLRRERSIHEEVCQFRMVTCSSCGQETISADLGSHALRCSQESQPDSSSHTESPPSLHLDELAEQSPSSGNHGLHACPHAPRCSWEGSESERDAHLVICPHEVVSSYCAQLERRVAQLEDDNHILRNRLSQLEIQFDVLRTSSNNNITFRSAPPLQSYPLGSPTLTDFASANAVYPAPSPSVDPSPITPSGTAFERLRSDMDSLNAGIAALEVKQTVALVHESARLREEMNSMRSLLCQAFQVQLLYTMERRKEGSSAESSGGHHGPSPTSASAVASAASALVKALGGAATASTSSTLPTPVSASASPNTSGSAFSSSAGSFSASTHRHSASPAIRPNGHRQETNTKL
ncbi:hypothetical protein BJ742DRAFT_794827 [Cladochytrium replicatum]|nr:hypothetical protein BJ742DRAFT_794827 [Cladochytrium replicatum]